MKWLDEGRRLRARVRADELPGLHLLVRTFGGTTAFALGINALGVAVVGLLLLALNTHATSQQRLVLGIVGAGYGLAAVAVGAVLGFVLQGRTLRWIAAGRRPTRDEARRALRNPLDLALVTGALWMLGALLMGVLTALLGAEPREIFGLVGGLVLAGLTTTGVTFLVAAQVGGPIAVRALEVFPPSEAKTYTMRVRMLLTWALTAGVPLLGIALVLSSPAHKHVVGAGLFTVFVALIVGIVGFSLLARAIGRPTRLLASALHEVGQGQFDPAVEVEVDRIGEIGALQRGVNDMIAGLRERERIRDLFGRQVGPAVADEAIRGQLRPGAEAHNVVALFVDITGSTQLTAELDPAEFVLLLNRFFAVVVAAVEAHRGLVNKFEGDAALCIFGAPVMLGDPATAGLRAAREIRDKVCVAGEVDVGIGVAFGAVIAGEIGAASRYEYTIIGDAVNEASRLTGEAKRVTGRILASAQTVESATPTERQHWTMGRSTVLRGRPVATTTYSCTDAWPAQLGTHRGTSAH